MRLFIFSCCRNLRGHFLGFRILGTTLLALSAGCTEFRTSPATPLPTVAVTNYQAGDQSAVSPIGYQEQPKSAVLPAVKELPPIGKIGKLEFSLTNPDEQVPASPPTVSDGPPSLPGLGFAETPAAAPNEVAPEPLPGQLPLAGTAHRAEEIGFIQGDPSKLVMLNLNAVLRHAERSKLPAEVLLQCASTYVDLLSARAALAVATQMDEKLEDLLQKTTNLAFERVPFVEGEVPRIQAEIDSEHLFMRKSRETTVAASARLLFLLGLDQSSGVAITDQQLTAFTLVQAELPAEQLIVQAHRRGPGVQGQTPNQQLQNKLTMAVQESREAVLSGRDQMEIGQFQLQHANAAFDYTYTRLTQAPDTKDRSPAEVLSALRTLQTASLNYLTAIRDHNKAQLRLAILTGSLVAARDN